MKYIQRITGLIVLLCGSLVWQNAVAKDELNVAYFLEWPSANQVAQVEKTYDKELGMEVNWKAFDNGNAMTAAMVAGDIDIAYSQGFVPYVVAVSKGVDLKLVGVAMTYAENDNCVVGKDSGITQANAKRTLRGKKIGTPTGNVTHYKLLKMLDHLGVDQKDVTILSMANTDVSSAFIRGDVDMGCAFGGSLNRMRDRGTVLMTGAEQEKIGLKVFDIVSVTGDFAREHSDVLTKFMQVTEDANRAYNKNPSKYYDTLSKASGMKRADAIDTLNKFTFLTVDQELSDQWLGGGIQSFSKEVADFFVEQNQLDKAAPASTYRKAVDASFLRAVK